MQLSSEACSCQGGLEAVHRGACWNSKMEGFKVQTFCLNAITCAVYKM